jgi:hypothetical protein
MGRVITVLNFSDASVHFYNVSEYTDPEKFIGDNFNESEISWMLSDDITIYKNDEQTEL